jgi:HEAT repeat protein
LGAIADTRACPVLLKGFSDSQRNNRAAAVTALYRIYDRSSVSSKKVIQDTLRRLSGDAVLAELLNLSHSGDDVLTDALLWIGALSRDPRFIPLLITAYGDDCTKSSALAALKTFECNVLYDVIARYPTFDENGRSVLCCLIAECSYSDFNNILQEGLRDPSPRVRSAAALAIGKLGLVECISDLVQLVDDSDDLVHSAAVDSLQILAKINRSLLQAEVGTLNTSHSSNHRKAAAYLLAALGEHERVQLLIKDEDPRVRMAAIAAIGANRIDASGSQLVLALADENPDVRIAVADTLGQLCDKRTLDALEWALNDEDAWVQSAVLKAIVRIEPARARAIIQKIHTVADGLLMITGIQILEQIGDTEAVEIIREALDNSDPDIARQAAMSLERLMAHGRS